MVVVLPAPLGPSSPSTSPSSTSKLTSEMASVRPKRRLTPMTRTPAVTSSCRSGAVVRRRYAHPLRVVVAGRDRRLGREGLGGVLPVRDGDAVMRGRRKVLGLVVEGAHKPVERVAVEIVEPIH